MSTTSTQYRFSVTSVKTILVAPSRIKQRELSLTPMHPQLLNTQQSFILKTSNYEFCKPLYNNLA